METLGIIFIEPISGMLSIPVFLLSMVMLCRRFPWLRWMIVAIATTLCATAVVGSLLGDFGRKCVAVLLAVPFVFCVVWILLAVLSIFCRTLCERRSIEKRRKLLYHLKDTPEMRAKYRRERDRCSRSFRRDFRILLRFVRRTVRESFTEKKAR